MADITHTIKEFETPREFQAQAIAKAVAYLNQGKSILIESPTGSGKTLMFSLIIREWNSRGRTLIMAPTILTCTQALEYRWVAERGGRDNWLAQIVVTTPQGAFNNLDAILKGGPVRLIVPDEAHGTAAAMQSGVIRRLKQQGALACGVTATPDRHDNQYLRAFDASVVATTIKEAIARGDIAKPNLKTYRMADGSRVVGHKDEIATVVYTWWLETKGKLPTILFTTSIEKSIEYADYCNKYGIKAAAVHSRLSKGERERVLEQYRRGEIVVLTNPQVLTMGANFPMTRCVVFAKGCESRMVFSQATGRGTRIGPNGEDWMLLLDFDYRDGHNLLPDHDGFGKRPPTQMELENQARWDRQRGMTAREAILDDRREMRLKEGYMW